jgi:methionine synthase / methylenetetrahydrofolate reductase(NADPH)
LQQLLSNLKVREKEMTREQEFRRFLQENLIVADGAMATLLYQLGLPVGVCYEELNLTHPALIRSVHDAYVQAGARLLETNTFGVNREALKRYGIEDKLDKILRAGAEICSEAAGDKAYVLGSIGSILIGRVRTEKLSDYRDQYEEQVTALLEGNVDGIILETFQDLDDLLFALEIVKSLTGRPVFSQLATQQVGRTRDGYTVTEAFRLLQQAGADVIGLNCRLGPAEMLRSLEQTQTPEGAILSIFPNAGRLGVLDGELSYKSSPEYFADYASRLREQGIQIIGGCCGTTPDHVRAMAEAWKGLTPLLRINPDPSARLERQREKSFPEYHKANIPLEHSLNRYPLKKKTILERVEEDFAVIVEFDPPKDLETDDFFRGCQVLHQAGIDAVTLADNSLANVRMSNMAIGALLKERYGIEPLLHVACRDRNLIGQQSHLMGLNALGIDQILVITGDPSKFGDLPGASSVFDVSSFDLIRMTKQLNEGISFSGQPLNHKANFIVGTAFNPYVRNFDAAIQRLQRKVEAGADYIMTQPVYDKKTIERIYEGTKNIAVPVFIGIMPLTSQRNAEFLHNEVPGISLSEDALKRMKGLKGEKARSEGITMSKELLEQAMKRFHGVYLITPFNYYEMTAELTEYVRKKSRLILKNT